MAERNIPDEHHVVRHCPKNRTIREGDEVVGVFPQLFELRVHRNEDYLSSCYYEFFAGTLEERLLRCVEATPRQIHNRDCMVVINVGETRKIAAQHSAHVRVVHQYDHPVNPAYAKIKGVPFDPSSAILTLLAEAAASNIFPVSKLRNGQP